jgi:predicted dehydrogenase
VGCVNDNGELNPMPRTHLGAILQNSDFELVAAVDAKEHSRQNFENMWELGVPTFGNLNLVKQKFDLVVIAVPTLAHYSVLKEALALKTAMIFCEKPFCANVAQAEEIAAQADQQKTAIVVNFHRRWDTKIREFKSIVEKQSEQPRSITIHYNKGLYNYASHIVDVVQMIFGEATLAKANRKGGAVDDPSHSASLKLKNGVWVDLIGVENTDYDLLEMEVYYSNVKFRLEFGGYNILAQESKSDIFFPGYSSLEQPKMLFSSGPVVGLVNAYREIAEVMRGTKNTSSCTSVEAIKTHRILNGIVSSLDSGLGVEL